MIGMPVEIRDEDLEELRMLAIEMDSAGIQCKLKEIVLNFKPQGNWAAEINEKSAVNNKSGSVSVPVLH